MTSYRKQRPLSDNQVKHGKKTPFYMVVKMIEDRGGTLITKENDYKDLLSKIDIKCNCGNEWKTTLNHIKNRNQWCPECYKQWESSGQNRMSEESKSKISKGHRIRNIKLGLLEKQSETHREIASRIREITTGLLRNPKKFRVGEKMIGCTAEEYKVYIISLLKEGMTLENRGFYGWHIDHTIPLALFDLSKEEELLKAANYKNTSPMWAKDNLSKH